MSEKFFPNNKFGWLVMFLLSSPVIVSILDIFKQGLISRNVAAITAAQLGHSPAIVSELAQGRKVSEIQPTILAPTQAQPYAHEFGQNKLAYRQISQDYWEYLQELERKDTQSKARSHQPLVRSAFPNTKKISPMPVAAKPARRFVLPQGYVAVECDERMPRIIERPVKVARGKAEQDYCNT